MVNQYIEHPRHQASFIVYIHIHMIIAVESSVIISLQNLDKRFEKIIGKEIAPGIGIDDSCNEKK